MQDFKVLQYKPSHKNEWNAFALDSNQQTFLFLRDFMDYHSDRFQDFSLMIYEEDELGNTSRKNERTWQKFEIERQYWQRRKVGYQVLTERDATKAESWNYNYFERGLGTKATSSELEAFCLDFIESWLASPRAELQEHLQRISTTNNESFQRVQSLFQSACQRSLFSGICPYTRK